MQIQFNKMPVSNAKQISENTQKRNQEEFKADYFNSSTSLKIQGHSRPLEFLFLNSRAFKDFQVLYKPCQTL
jgi:hypothetical protein